MSGDQKCECNHSRYAHVAGREECWGHGSCLCPQFSERNEVPVAPLIRSWERP